MRRASDRAWNELRPVTVSIGQLSRADGSSSFAFGSECSLASFHGPGEVKIRDERVDGAFLEIVHRPLDRLSSTGSKALVETIAAIQTPLLQLSLHPRSLIQIVVQSMTPSVGASASASAINACSVAALDAGSIAIRNVAVAVVVAFDASDEMVLDPDEDELVHAKSVHAFAWAGEDVVWVESEGAFSRQQFERALEQSRLACATILSTIFSTLSVKLIKQ